MERTGLHCTVWRTEDGLKRVAGSIVREARQTQKRLRVLQLHKAVHLGFHSDCDPVVNIAYVSVRLQLCDIRLSSDVEFRFDDDSRRRPCCTFVLARRGDGHRRGRTVEAVGIVVDSQLGAARDVEVLRARKGHV